VILHRNMIILVSDCSCNFIFLSPASHHCQCFGRHFAFSSDTPLVSAKYNQMMLLISHRVYNTLHDITPVHLPLIWCYSSFYSPVSGFIRPCFAVLLFPKGEFVFLQDFVYRFLLLCFHLYLNHPKMHSVISSSLPPLLWNIVLVCESIYGCLKLSFSKFVHLFMYFHY
jgi:hypothetical protein